MQRWKDVERQFKSDRFATALSFWKYKHNKSQEDFMKLMGYSSKNTVTNWNKGRIPDKIIPELCKALEVDEDYFEFNFNVYSQKPKGDEVIIEKKRFEYLLDVENRFYKILHFITDDNKEGE